MSSRKGSNSLSNYGTGIKDTKDVVIQQLRREVEELRQSQQHSEELISKIENLEHLNLIISDEKRRMEDEAMEKNNKHIRIISEMRAEIETSSIKIGELQYEVANLQKQNDWFEDSLRQKGQDLKELQDLLDNENAQKSDLSEELKKLKGSFRDLEIEKEELSKALERHNNYIEELLENIKEKDVIITSLEQDKAELEDEVTQIRREIDNFNLENDNLKESLELTRSQFEESMKERNDLEEDIINLKKENDLINEENKQHKRRVESLRDNQEELESELKNQLNRVEILTSTLELESEKIDSIKSEKSDLETKLTNMRSDNDILRRELEKVGLDRQEFIEEVGRFKHLNDGIKAELEKKENTQEYMDQADKELKNALENLKETLIATNPVAGTTHNMTYRSYRSNRGFY